VLRWHTCRIEVSATQPVTEMSATGHFPPNARVGSPRPRRADLLACVLIVRVTRYRPTHSRSLIDDITPSTAPVRTQQAAHVDCEGFAHADTQGAEFLEYSQTRQTHGRADE